MNIIDRLLGRQPAPPASLDEPLDDLLGELVVTNVRYHVQEPVVADVEIPTAWGRVLVRDVGLADPDGTPRLVSPWIYRANQTTKPGYHPAVELPAAMRHDVLDRMREAWRSRRA